MVYLNYIVLNAKTSTTNLIRMASQDDVGQHQKEFVAALERAQKEIMMILAMGAFPRFINPIRKTLNQNINYI